MDGFETLSAQEAKAYLRSFVADLPDRLDTFRQVVETAGGPAADLLDLSIDSLDPLWDWAAPRFAFRDGYVPAPMGSPQPIVDLRTIEPQGELPPWTRGDWIQFWVLYSTPTLQLLDGVGSYLGEVLVSSVDGAGWRVARSRVKGYTKQNHPVVGPLPSIDDVEPFQALNPIVRNHLEGRGIASLAQLVRTWTA